MASATNPIFSKYSPQTQLSLDSGMKAAEAASVVFPPAYLAYAGIFRKGTFSVRSLMGVSTGAVIVGGAIGAGLGYVRFKNEPEYSIAGRIDRLRHDAASVRMDDYSIIGSVLGALLVPAVFLKRAPLPALVLGGASIGLGGGVWAHLVQSLSTGEKIKPEVVKDEPPK